MLEDKDKAWYAAFKSKDSRFDGRFFVGVSSTGIYCRPVCRAKLPKEENCTFYSTAAEAERAGYRPCLLCRPEIAPGTSAVDATASLVSKATRLLEENCGNGQSLEEFAERLGCTSRHLRRAFTEEYHVSPVQYLQTCRLLLAKNLLTDTSLSILDIAMASGFGSLRRFNDLFKKQYRMPPTALRKLAPGEERRQIDVTLALGYRPPYQWDRILKFLAQRAISGVEAVDEESYMRTVRLVSGELKEACGWIRVTNRPAQNVLNVTISSALLSVLPQILARIRCLFDLYCDPEAVSEVLSPMNDIRPDLFVSGTRVPGCFEPYEMAVRAVLGQQISVKAAGTLAARLAETYGTPLQTGIEGLTHVFPAPERMIALGGTIENHLGPLGITSARARTILELSRIFAQKKTDVNLCSGSEREVKVLMDIPGIGAWTARYIAMRAMGWPDVFLDTDYGVKKALAPLAPGEILTLAQTWHPWRSYATVNLWNSL